MQRLSDATVDLTAQQCALDVLDAVPPVIWFIRQEMRAYRKELSLAQFRALARVQRSPAVNLSAVADHLGCSLPAASRLVQGLVQQGLLKRTGCPKDRRQLELAITDSGLDVLTAAWSGTQDKLSQELEKLAPEQRRTVAEAMQSLKQLFGALGLCESESGKLLVASRDCKDSETERT